MRRLVAVVSAAVALLTIAAVAFAQTQQQVNQYTVKGTVAPSKKPGSKKKPVPFGVTFSYTVSEQHGWRPSPVKTYAIDFYGVRAVNGKYFPKCTAKQINGNQQGTSDSVCPKGSKVGTGKITAVVGPPADPTVKSFTCSLTLDVYNSGTGKGALWIHRGSSDQCPVDTHQAIPTKYVAGSPGGSTALKFTVPPELLHNTGLDISTTAVTSQIKKLTKHVKSKGKTRTVGYYESVACKGSKRPTTVTFTSEAGHSTPVSDTKSSC